MHARGAPLHVLHVLHRFDTGGLENGVVNLINQMPPERVRHTVLALTQVAPAFSRRIQRTDVRCLQLNKSPGQLVWQFGRLYRLFRDLAPDVLHTRNLAALECHLPAAWAGVPVRIHGEHGRDADDLHGTNRKNRLLRRVWRRWPQHYVALSSEIAEHLRADIGVPANCLTQISNGVDTARFTPPAARLPIDGAPFNDPQLWVVGTVGRMEPVKAQTVLARAFVRAVEQAPELKSRLRLVLVGDGPLRAQCHHLLEAAGVSDLAWLPGERSDIPALMRGLDAFVLPSLAEGISNTVLEAMASGLPVIATRVGGNTELVADGHTGTTVPSGNVQALADALLQSAADPARSRAQGRHGRARVEQRHSLAGMVAAYLSLYETQLTQRVGAASKGAGAAHPSR